jgi:hypothetical protein
VVLDSGDEGLDIFFLDWILFSAVEVEHDLLPVFRFYFNCVIGCVEALFEHLADIAECNC